MPRKMIAPEPPAPANHALVDQLCDALKSRSESGQPLIYEEEFGDGNLRITVVWDEWVEMSLDQRSAIILRAYELAEGKEYRDRIVLVSGLTVPEATAAGMLPFQVGTAWRRTDRVTLQQCWDAMKEEGASELFGSGILQLRFATREEAEACRNRLIRRLPGSEDVWVISVEVSVQDRLSMHDSATAALN